MVDISTYISIISPLSGVRSGETDFCLLGLLTGLSPLSDSMVEDLDLKPSELLSELFSFIPEFDGVGDGSCNQLTNLLTLKT